MGVTVGVAVGVALGQPNSALFTAWMINTRSTPLGPLGTPFGQTAALAVPRSMFTSKMSSSIVTLPSSLQSPTQVGTDGVGVAVGGVADEEGSHLPVSSLHTKPGTNPPT